MCRSPKNSGRRRPQDLEAGDGGGGSFNCDSDYPFSIASTKNASAGRFLRRWKSAPLAIKASRRFRYTLDFEMEELIRAARAQAARAAVQRGAEGGPTEALGTATPTSPSTAFQIRRDELVPITRDRSLSALDQHQGATGLSVMLNTDLNKGISGDIYDLQRRKQAFGSNTYPRKKGRSFWRFLWEASQDMTLISLVLGAIATLLLGIKTEANNHGWYDEAGIAFTITLVIIVTAINDYWQSFHFEKLDEEKRDIRPEVIRDGKRIKISMYGIVVGDIIPLRAGDQVPADGVLFYGYSLQIDESEITGVSGAVMKEPLRDPFLSSGSKVEEGVGTMLVTSVGINTQSLMANIPEDTGEETPLQVCLNGIATAIGLISLSLAVVVILIGSCRYFTGHAKNTDGTPMFVAGKTRADEAMDNVIKTIILGVTIVVVAVPAGLPLAVTLNLSYTRRRMVAEKVVVQRLSACETMGFVTTILCHKTGVLTLNQMTVVEAYTGGKRLQHLDSISQFSPNLKLLIIEGIAQNTNGSVFLPDGNAEPEVSGSPTEQAILNWGVKLGMKFDDVRSKSSILHVSPFNPNKKRRGVALKLHDSQVRVHWKGAAEAILASCAWYMDMDNVAAMDDEKVLHFKSIINDMANRGLRCAAIACLTCEAGDFLSNEQLSRLPEGGLILLAIVGIKDPCQPGIRDAIQQCQTAGVKVCMVTGDDLRTAKATALACGILTSDVNTSEHTVIEGNEFRSLPVLERERIAENILVIARSSPGDHLLLVEALKKKGHVVAVTGKGIHDARALREADIGVAMGIAGTAVAKRSSDIIILDDSFASVVKAVRWGRSLYTNMQKLAQFRLTVSAAALVICVIVAVYSGDFPLNVVQLLVVNLVIDTFGALALASEPPTHHLMQRPPVRKRDPFINKLMWLKFLIQVAYQVVALLVPNFQGKSVLQLKDSNLTWTDKVKNTLVFNSFVFCQAFNEFECRDLGGRNIFTGIFRNHMFLGTVTLTVILQVIVIEFLGIFMSTVRLDWKQWLISIAIGFFSQLANRFPCQAFPYLRN